MAHKLAAQQQRYTGASDDVPKRSWEARMVNIPGRSKDFATRWLSTGTDVLRATAVPATACVTHTMSPGQPVR